MSTRCQMQVNGSNVFLYKHSDGYPEGVLPTLLPLLKDFSAVRGNDPEYLNAQIIHTFVANSLKEREKWNRDENVNKMFRYTGFGIDTELHIDIEYLYVINRDSVDIRKTAEGFGGNATIANTKIVQTVDFDGNDVPQP